MWTLFLYVIYFSVALFGRAYIQKMRTGSFGINKFGARVFSREWAANALVAFGAALGLLAVLAEIGNITHPIGSLDSFSGHIIGFALYGFGLLIMFHSQLVMGASWRVGVDHSEKTELVTHGIYSVVRNPIYTAGSLISLGFIFILPDPLLITSFIIQYLGLELHVRNVEEPYLLKVHGARYAEYFNNTGRFFPRIYRNKF